MVPVPLLEVRGVEGWGLDRPTGAVSGPSCTPYTRCPYLWGPTPHLPAASAAQRATARKAPPGAAPSRRVVFSGIGCSRQFWWVGLVGSGLLVVVAGKVVRARDCCTVIAMLSS